MAKKDKSKCHWCQVTLLAAKWAGGTHRHCRTVDHIKCKAECKSRGEYVNDGNKVWACHGCNQKRNDEYLAAHPQPQRIEWVIEARNLNLAKEAHRKNFEVKRTKTGEISNLVASSQYFHTHY